jgi:hypothetical protein
MTTAPIAPAHAAQAASGRFVSAEDFDATGILAGVDPCESRYWWVPELYGPETAGLPTSDSPAELYAARRPSTPAAA